MSTPKKKSHSEMDDFLRPLTKQGIFETKEIIQSSYFIFKDMTQIFSSPLLRAIKTAQLIYAQNSQAQLDFMTSLDKLAPLKDFQQDLLGLDENACYCFVGHEPHLSASINLLLNQNQKSVISLQKSGILVLEGRDLSSLKITTLISPRLVLKF